MHHGRCRVISATTMSDINITEEKLNKMIGILASMPPVVPQPIIETPKEKCACGKMVHVNSLEALDTGVFKTLNDVCVGCKDGKKIDKELARVVCARCKRVIIRLKPAKDVTGFTFEAGRTYHVSECSLCNPSIQRCPIIEKVLWNKRRHVN